MSHIYYHRLLSKTSLLFLVSMIISFSAVAQVTVTGLTGLTLTTSPTDYTSNISDAFSYHGMSFSKDGSAELTLKYIASTNEFHIYGAAKADLPSASAEVSMSFGSANEPGFKIVNGAVTHFDIEFSGGFDLEAMKISPNGLRLTYDSDGSVYAIYGTGELEIGTDKISAGFGTTDEPGLTIKNGVIDDVFIDLNTTFSLLTANFTGKDLAMRYRPSTKHFEISGEAIFAADGQSFDVIAGNSANPGIIINRGEVSHLALQIISDFHLKGLEFQLNQAAIAWDKTHPKRFNFSGEAKVSLAGELIDVVIGETSDPGLIIDNGRLTKLDMVVNSDIKVGTVTFKAVDLRIKDVNNQWQFGGDVVIQEFFELDITLGENGAPGILLDIRNSQAHVRVGKLTFDLKFVELGAFNIKEMKLVIDGSRIEDVLVDVILPGNMEVAGEIKFNSQSQITEFKVWFDAASPEAGIPLPGDGRITHIEGDLINLNSPANIEFSGDISIIFGGPFAFDGKEVAFLYLNTSGKVTRDGITLKEQVYIGAYEDRNEWKALLLRAEGTLDIRFGQYVSLHAEMVMLPDVKLVDIISDFYLDDKQVSALIEVDLYVPDQVPVVGGDKLASVDGALKYIYRDLNNSYAAGWAEVGTGALKVTVGGKLNFGSREISLIGAKEVSNIRHENSTSTGFNFNIMSTYHFTIDKSMPHAAILKLKFPGHTLQFNTNVWGPDDKGLSHTVLTTSNPGKGAIKIYGDYYATVDNDVAHRDSVLFMIFDKNAVVNSTRPYLPPGKYTIQFSRVGSDLPTPSNTTFSVTGFYFPPIIQISNSSFDDGIFNAEVLYYARSGTNLIDFYAVEHPDRDAGILLNETPFYVPGTNVRGGKRSYSLNFNRLIPNKTYYVYATINDELSAVVKSTPVGSFTYQGSIHGKVSKTSRVSHTLAGVMLYIDANNNGVFDPESEVATYTNVQGEFAFSNLSVNSDYHVGIVLPPGHRLATNSPIKYTNKRWPAKRYAGQTIEFDFIIDLN